MRLIIFASVAMLGMSVAASGLSNTANAISKERISGTVSDVYNGGAIAIDGYSSHLRLEAVSDGFPATVSDGTIRQSLSSMIEGKTISCQRLYIDNYGAVVARCWDDAGNAITKSSIRKNISLLQ